MRATEVISAVGALWVLAIAAVVWIGRWHARQEPGDAPTNAVLVSCHPCGVAHRVSAADTVLLRDDAWHVHAVCPDSGRPIRTQALAWPDALHLLSLGVVDGETQVMRLRNADLDAVTW